MPLVSLLLGRPLANKEFSEREIDTFEGIPAMGLDGLGRLLMAAAYCRPRTRNRVERRAHETHYDSARGCRLS
jgi:hypothetical protein